MSSAWFALTGLSKGNGAGCFAVVDTYSIADAWILGCQRCHLVRFVELGFN
ncbi:hypothetical protein LINGRAPRIM_LOCUS727 [Linum grandiflorum]